MARPEVAEYQAFGKLELGQYFKCCNAKYQGSNRAIYSELSVMNRLIDNKGDSPALIIALRLSFVRMMSASGGLVA